ncbi:MAG: hypothetical protein ACUZ8H_10945 [Candidatus Anammoxibacter sp.]
MEHKFTANVKGKQGKLKQERVRRLCDDKALKTWRVESGQSKHQGKPSASTTLEQWVVTHLLLLPQCH